MGNVSLGRLLSIIHIILSPQSSVFTTNISHFSKLLSIAPLGIVLNLYIDHYVVCGVVSLISRM